MKIVTLKDLTLVSSDIPEDQYQGSATANGKWAAGTYANGDVVYYDGSTPHKVYQSIVSSNTATPGTDPTKWTDLGATDRWLMFDEYMTTQTTHSASFSVTVSAQECDYVGVFNCDATSITFELYDDSVLQASDVVDMDSSEPTDYDEWFWSPAEYRLRYVWEFPYLATSTATLKVTFTNTITDVACGALAIGSAYETGGTQYSSEIGFKDYSYFYENETTGAISLTPGNYVDTGSLKVWVGNAILDAVMRKLKSNRGKVAIYDFNNDGCAFMESLVFYGITNTPKVSISGPNMSRFSFSMRGVI